jgi:tetratricopeptide (TPR) repeat protein
LGALVLGFASPSVFAAVTAYQGTVQLPTYPWDPPVRHPYFRGTDGRNIYPYPMLDNLQRTSVERVWQTVVLENEALRLTFLPELGGKVWEILDKTTDQPMFYVNHVVKPGLIGQCGAWVSGGIEFNTGPAGHTVSAVLPVDVRILPPAPDGSRSVAVGEVERIYRTRWTVVVTLRPGRSFIEERIRITNPTETVRPYYFWNCTAVPNTPGFRFIYPMTLGSDHGGDNFYTWPLSDGKDLSYARNYQDASSIFAYDCDQDFFGSYDEETDRGVVAYANHHQLPGKKAWTWGRGSYGTMHQMDLTDHDGPYNEVQTGPLLTQADVGRLDPGEVLQWQEWWYPVHGLGGFNYANRDFAAHATVTNAQLRLRLMGTGTWSPVEVRVLKGEREVARDECELSPRKAADLRLDLQGATEPLEVNVRAMGKTLGHFRVPLDLPARTPPKQREKPRTAAEYVQAGWQDYLFAKFPEAERQFRQALERDMNAVGAHVGLAYLNLDRDPAAAADAARAALRVEADHGLARFVLATAEERLAHPRIALEHAWKASLDPATAAAGRSLAAKLHLQLGEHDAAARALSEPGPWQADAQARNRLALAMFLMGEPSAAVRLAGQSLEEDPLDAFAHGIVWLGNDKTGTNTLATLLGGKPQAVLDLAAEFVNLGQTRTALRAIDEFYGRHVPPDTRHPIVSYWAAYLSQRLNLAEAAAEHLRAARAASVEGVFPHRFETVPVLRWALEKHPRDGSAALYLGHLLFALGRHAEGRGFWKQASEAGVAPGIVFRALGMASRQLENNLNDAERALERAHRADPTDPIIARDLAHVLFAQSDQANSDARRRELAEQARARLLAALDGGRGRSDFVALLARAQNRLGQFAETARWLDSVRITIWEGAREVHDLFEEAHLALGRAHLDAGRAAEALAEFDRALVYPANLATGRLEGAREAHVHYLRGQALAALNRQTEAIAAWRKAVDEPSSKEKHKEEARQKAREALERAGAK